MITAANYFTWLPGLISKPRPTLSSNLRVTRAKVIHPPRILFHPRCSLRPVRDTFELRPCPSHLPASDSVKKERRITKKREGLKKNVKSSNASPVYREKAIVNIYEGLVGKFWSGESITTRFCTDFRHNCGYTGVRVAYNSRPRITFG